jgi:hypothetical protein
VRFLSTFVALAGIAGALAVGAHADEACAQEVLADWADDGMFEREYLLPCYEEAIAALPPDIRDYTDAREQIERELMSVARDGNGPTAGGANGSPEALGPIDDSGSSTLPWPLLALGGLGVALVAATGVAVMARRASLGRKEPPG